MTAAVTPFSLKDAPALIEILLPVQKLSAEAYKEQMANQGKTLNGLGSYWKGRKPLILNKACILGCLLPATDNASRDLEIFEMLMAMDDESFSVRWPRRPKPREVLSTTRLKNVSDYFVMDASLFSTDAEDIDWNAPELKDVKVSWRHDVSELERRRLEAEALQFSKMPYRQRVAKARRPEEISTVHDHIWQSVNNHLGTNATSYPELVEQLGIMRFGHRPRLADSFCGSGQIPFEAARLGCDVFASDLNPIACMLTWGAFNVVGGSADSREELRKEQQKLLQQIQSEIDSLGVETDGNGWRAKAFLYCVEVRCPQSGWLVPLMPSFVISSSRKAIAKLVPDQANKRYHIEVRVGVSESEFVDALNGTVAREGKYGDAYMVHVVDGVVYKTNIATLRGDYQKGDGTTGNRQRAWEKQDFKPQHDDIFQERLYCIHWMRPKESGRTFEYEFRSVSIEDLSREKVVEQYIAHHIVEWQMMVGCPICGLK